MSTASPAGPAPLLPRPAGEVARLLGLRYLEQADSARRRLDDPDDTEALHDVRVALRRLRSGLRAFRPQLEGSVGRGLRRRLRRLADASGGSRDLQVHLAWVADQEADLRPWQQAGSAWLMERLARRAEEAGELLSRELFRDFGRLHERLTRRLSVYPVRVSLAPVPPQESAGAVVAGQLCALGESLQRLLAVVHAITDDEPAHAARIAAKRLRYMLEPFVPELPAAAPLVERLKQLQDLLGDLHDAHVFAGELREALEEATVHLARRTSHQLMSWHEPDTAEEPDRLTDPRHGIMALGGRLRARGERTFAQVRELWLEGAGADFFRQLDLVGAAAASAGRPPLEIERKYLLSALPERALGAPVEEIDQGWLPGVVLVERVRRVRTAAGEAWFRTVKVGDGVTRVELEEPAAPDVGERLWGLTAGCRVHKRRYRVPEGSLTWEIDQFLDRDLVLAEVELIAEDTPVTVPDWLAPYLVREVTGAAEYVNRNLAG